MPVKVKESRGSRDGKPSVGSQAWKDEQRKEKRRRTEEAKRRKQLRARARRAVDDQERKKLQRGLMKPVSEWDIEELAAGRPKGEGGRFSGPKPQWVTREVHEAALAEFKTRAAQDARGLVPLALDRIKALMTDEEMDEKGRPVVPRGVQADLAKWAVEHLLGKPTQRQEVDVSVRLQSILGAAMVSPDRIDTGLKDGYVPAIEAESWDAGLVGDDEALDEFGDG